MWPAQWKFLASPLHSSKVVPAATWFVSWGQYSASASTAMASLFCQKSHVQTLILAPTEDIHTMIHIPALRKCWWSVYIFYFTYLGTFRYVQMQFSHLYESDVFFVSAGLYLVCDADAAVLWQRGCGLTLLPVSLRPQSTQNRLTHIQGTHTSLTWCITSFKNYLFLYSSFLWRCQWLQISLWVDLVTQFLCQIKIDMSSDNTA